MISTPRKILRTGTVGAKVRIILLILIIAYGLCNICIYMAFISLFLCVTGMSYAVIPVMSALAVAIVLISSVFRAGGMLFGFRDYDVIVSMPIPTLSIAASRFASLYVFDLIFTLLIFVPSALVYAVYTHPDLLFYLLFIPSALILPLIPCVIGSAVGTLISRAASGLRRKNIVSIIAGFSFVFSIIFVSTKLTGVSTKAVINFGKSVYENLAWLYFPSRLLGSGMSAQAQILPWLVFAVLSVGITALFLSILAANFKSVNSALTSQRMRLRALKPIKTRSTPRKALFLKELRRYFSSPVYVLNSAMGALMFLMLSAAIVFYIPADILQPIEYAGIDIHLSKFLPVILLFPVVMCSTTSSAISLEGNSRYILTGAPIRRCDIYNSKIAVNLAVLFPVIVISAVMFIFSANRLSFSGTDLLFLFLMPATAAFFTSVLGLYVNLKFPRFDWKSEAQVIKQSASSVISLLGGMAAVILSVVTFTIVSTLRPEAAFLDATLAVITGCFAVLSVFLYSRVLKIDFK